jgi:hypothetical protein
MTAQAIIDAIIARGGFIELKPNGGLRCRAPRRLIPLVGERKAELIAFLRLRPPAPRVHRRLERALVRELYAGDGQRHFLLDITVKMKMLLLDAIPQGIDATTWRAAITALSRAVEASGEPIPQNYDQQPTISLPWKQ